MVKKRQQYVLNLPTPFQKSLNNILNTQITNFGFKSSHKWNQISFSSSASTMKIVFAFVVIFCGFQLSMASEVDFNPPIPDCTADLAFVSCPIGTTYRPGNLCTDHCHRELMDCIPKTTCGCYCTGELRKVDGKCAPKDMCPELE